ncbi:uncharacterized protein LOC112492793 [Ziziphus jujuba]|uniref:Uncharacterized protein LOC112492793 n=1 Tax=Ziziphus jujuba TaxID=326968 RepID=A0A6P6GFL8_ZIZJJ|nr:uncharacterized protein LOC112492793 [Ziziphus jujuba]
MCLLPNPSPPLYDFSTDRSPPLSDFKPSITTFLAVYISTDTQNDEDYCTAGSKAEEKKVEETAFEVKLEKFENAAKIKVIKEVRAFTNLGLKEAKVLVEKAPVLFKQEVTKEEPNDMIEKIKAAG